MKTMRTFIKCLLLCSLIISGCNEKEEPLLDTDELTFESEDDTCEAFDNPEGVVVNGVRWATRNVGTLGTFVSSPCDYGEYYQFNKGTTDFLLYSDYYNSIYSESGSWLPANDPSPAGWRVPTLAEIQKLLEADKVSNEWINKNGLTGRKFTDRATDNSIFFPAAGYRYYYDGVLNDVGSIGYYWSSAANEDDYDGACYLGFVSAYTNWDNWYYRGIGFSVRPVAEN